MQAFSISPDSNFQLPGLGNVDLKNLSGHVQRLWEHLDDLASNNPDGYKAFLEQQAKAAGVDTEKSSHASSKDEVLDDFPAVVLTSTITAKSKFSKAKKPCMISFWQPLPGHNIKPAKSGGKKLNVKSKLQQPLEIPMQLRRPNFQATGDGGEHEVFELVVHPEVLELTVLGQPEGMLGVLSHMGLQHLKKTVGLDISIDTCKVKVVSPDVWKKKLKPGTSRTKHIKPSTTAAPTPQSSGVPATEAAKGTSLESLPSSLLQQLSTLAAPTAHNSKSSAELYTETSSVKHQNAEQSSIGSNHVKSHTKPHKPLIQVLKEETILSGDSGEEENDDQISCRDLDKCMEGCCSEGAPLEQLAGSGTGFGSSLHSKKVAQRRIAADTHQVRDRGHELTAINTAGVAHSQQTLGKSQCTRKPGIEVLPEPRFNQEEQQHSDVLPMLYPTSAKQGSARPLIQELDSHRSGTTDSAHIPDAKAAKRASQPFKMGFLTHHPKNSKQPGACSTKGNRCSTADCSQGTAAVHTSTHSGDKRREVNKPPSHLQCEQSKAETPCSTSVPDTASKSNLIGQQPPTRAATQDGSEGQASGQYMVDDRRVADAMADVDCQVVEEGCGSEQRIRVTCRIPWIQRAADTQLDMIHSQLLSLSYPMNSSHGTGHIKQKEIYLPRAVDVNRVQAKFVKKSSTLHVYLLPAASPS